MKKLFRTEGEIDSEINTLVARADELEAKANSDEGLTPEETTELDGIVAKLKELGVERNAVVARTKFAALKEELKQPTTPAPAIPASIKRTQAEDPNEGMSLWMKSHFNPRGLTPDDYSKMQRHGFIPGSESATFRYDLRDLNHKKFKRTKLSTGGSGTGAELTHKTYSQKLTEYVNYNSPFVAALASEVVDEGNSERTFHRIDPTSLKSTKITASSGTELNPTIPAVNPTTSKVLIKPFTLTAGRFEVTYEMAHSSSFPIVDRLAGWCAGSDVSAIEELVLTDTGNGSNGGMQGLLTAAEDFTPVTGDDVQTKIEEMYFKIPKQYRDKAIMVCNDFTMGYFTQELKDGDGRSLLGKTFVDGLEWESLTGKPFYISRYMPDYQLLYFVPEFYQLLFGGSAELQVFKERYWPDRAVSQLSMVSGAWLGPANAAWLYDFDDS